MSSHSSGNGECVEVCDAPATVRVRDSKDPDGPIVTVSRATWSALHAQIQRGTLDL
nr:DUF397 domain-containing protein [Actinomadura atramentaria]